MKKYFFLFPESSVFLLDILIHYFNWKKTNTDLLNKTHLMHDKKEIAHTFKHTELTKGEKSNNNWTFAFAQAYIAQN